MFSKENIEYYVIHETMVDEDITRKHHKILKENVVGSGDNRILTITFQQVLQSLTRNWNGRTYTESVITNAINNNPLVQYDLTHGGLFGEYGHPIIEKGQNEIARQMTIFPPNVCWRISNPHFEGNLLLGECTTVAGGYGDMLRDRVLSGDPAMASSRGVGGVDKNGNVVNGYTLITWDGVYRPSHREAYNKPDTVKVNTFQIPNGNTMTESTSKIDCNSDGFKNFLMSESASREKVERICDTMNIDYNSIVISEGAIRMTKYDGNEITKVVLPLNRVIAANQHYLFD